MTKTGKTIRKGVMLMEHQFQPFKTFVPGNHLVLGEAGVGKTRLIWSLLQSPEFYDQETINIVLTSSEHIWQNHIENPIIPVDPYATDMRWIAEPSEPGTYYAACDYLPRVLTFLECLANYARKNEENFKKTIRVFIDFPIKFWLDACFVEQLARLHYISESLVEDGICPLHLWVVMPVLKELTMKAKSLIKNSHLIFINPFSQTWLEQIKDIMAKPLSQLEKMTNAQGKSTDTGFYYLPSGQTDAYLQKFLFD